MKVLFATYPWAFHVPGGGEEQVMRYCENLPSCGIEPLLFDPWRPQLDDVDLVHFFSTISGSAHFCAYVKSLGLPILVSSSLWVTPATRGLYPVGEIRAQLLLADAIIPNSGIEADMLSQVFDLPRDRFIPVHNGVDPRFAEPADPDAFASRYGLGQPFLLNVGNIEPRKNQLNLVRAAKRLGLPLVLIGNVRDRAYFDRVAGENGDAVLYLGALAHQDPILLSAYAGCAAFVLPSTLETPGLAALEAAAAGARLVVTTEGSTHEYFGELADYADPRSPEDIAAGVERALLRPASPTLRDHVLDRFAWTKVVGDLADAYRAVLTRVDSNGAHA